MYLPLALIIPVVTVAPNPNGFPIAITSSPILNLFELPTLTTFNDSSVEIFNKALLKISTDESLNVVKVGNSNKLRIGEDVIAIGNPLGFGATVTTGIISAKGRYIDGLGTYVDFLQTDAALNRGNSGGPPTISPI